MFSLTKIYDDTFDYQGITMSVDMTYDNILRLFELFEDNTFTNYEKVLIALEMLLDNYYEIEDLNFLEQLEIYKYLLKEFLGIETSSDEDEETGEASKEVKKFDFEKDADLIYASFLSEFKIDLFEVQGKLHWEKFSALLNHLSDNTAFKQVVKFRTMKVPTEKEASKEYRSHVQKMKRIYSLEDEESAAENLESTLDSIASTFTGGNK